MLQLEHITCCRVQLKCISSHGVCQMGIHLKLKLDLQDRNQPHHTFLDYPPNSMKFNEMINIEWDENTGLLITCEDLDLETTTDIVFPVQHAYMLLNTPEENGVYSDSILNFKKELCLDVVNNLSLIHI